MKYSIMTMFALTLTLPVVANNQRPAGNDNNNQNQQQVAGYAQNCVVTLKEVSQITEPEVKAQKMEEKEYKECEAAEKVAKEIGKSNLLSQSAYQTADGRAVCRQIAGYTIDYDSCAGTAKMYDGLLVASQALEMQAELRAQNSQKEIAQQAQQKALSGDVQGAGLQASKDNSSTMKRINQEKAAAYTAAVAALGAKIAGWDDDIEDVCKGNKECSDLVTKAAEGAGEKELFANRDMKAIFIQALAEFTGKGLAAGIAASQYKSSEEAVAKIQNTYEEDILDVQLDECVINPMAKKCLGPGTRVAGESFSGGAGNFSIGGAGSNAFDLGAGQDEFGEFGDAANIESQQVAGINSPFEDQVKEANDILDQAGAASAGSGDGAAPGGGGGGGGMGGGGSASLGNDTKTPDESSKEAEIKATKSNVAYGGGAGAKGFSGVKSGKEDSNPFASLFDQKGSSGGLEEDRSIASNDIDDKSSVLFQKISKKYSEMHSSKRIQANNLELE